MQPELTISSPIEKLQNKVWRQSHLEVSPAPKSMVAYVCSIAYNGDSNENGLSLHVFLHFIPDCFTLSHQQLKKHILFCIPMLAHCNLNEYMLCLLDDLNDILIPKWLQLSVQMRQENNHLVESFLIEDRQPRWDHPSLLARIASYDPF